MRSVPLRRRHGPSHCSICSSFERFEQHTDHAVSRPRAVKHRDAAGDHHDDRVQKVGFSMLELGDAVEIVGFADVGRLQEFVKPVEQDHRQRVAHRPDELPPRQALSRWLVFLMAKDWRVAASVG